MTSVQGVRQKATGSFTVGAWTGDREALLRVVKLCRDLEARAKRDREDELVATSSERKVAFAKIFTHLDAKGLGSRWEAHEAEELADSRRDLTLRMRATEMKWDREYSGDPDDVMQEIDLGQVVKISLSLGGSYVPLSAGGISMELDFNRASGCVVRASAPRSDWVVLVDGQLRPLLAERRPWYWWLLNASAAPLVLAVPFFATSLAWLKSMPHEKPIPVSSWILIGGLLAASAIFVGLGVFYLMRRVLPAFELLPTGQEARGSKRLGMVLGVIVWVVGVIVVPLVLQKG